MAGITDTLNSFSQRLKRFNQASSGGARRVEDKGENYGSRDPKFLQQQIRERSERLKSGVVATYKIYRAPFEALGEKSDRAALIDQDQQLLLEAYNLYKGVMDLNAGAEGEASEQGDAQDQIGNRRTFISKIELNSPLAQKASYTSGGQFVYLMMWLYFEQNCREYIPFFKEMNNDWSLGFVRADNYSFEGNEKEIFEIVKNEFYGGE